MTDLEQLAEIVKGNLMAKQNEDWGYPRGWNGHAEFVLKEIQKMKMKSPCPHGFSMRGSCSECNFD